MSRSERRANHRRRVVAIGGSVLGLIAVVALVLAWASDDSSGVASSSRRRTTHPKAKSATHRHRVGAVGRTRSSASSTTSTTSTAAGDPADNSASSTTSTTAPAPDAPTDPLAGLTLLEDPGACQWNADTEELVDTGSVRNDTTEDAVVEVEITWVDSTGELDSTSDLVLAGPQSTEKWQVSTSWTEAPQGLSCRSRLVP